MALSEAQEAKLQAARAAHNKQDRKQPYLIHVDHGGLLPNVPNLRKHAKLRVFTGDPKASAEERLRWLHTGGASAAPVVAARAGEPFVISKATKEELVEFAATEFGTDLSTDTDIRTLRKQVLALAEKAQAEAGGADDLG